MPIFDAMFTRLVICFLSLLSTSAPIFAQWGWVDNSQGSANLERVEDVAVDDVNGAIYSVGFVTGNSSFPEFPSTALHGGDDGFVMKYDLNGNVLWSFVIGGNGDDRIHGVTVDEATESVYVTGYLEGSNVSNNTTLSGMPGTTSSGSVIGTSGARDAFVAKYNGFGQLLWYQVIGGSGLDQGMDISVNGTYVFMNGIYTNTSLIGSLLPILPYNDEINNFVVALNPSNGNTVWDAVLASTTDDYNVPVNNTITKRIGITADDSAVYLVTYFSGATYRVYNSSDVLSASISDPNGSQEDFVVTSYTNAGLHNWSVLYDNDGAVSFGLDITNDCSGVYVSGTLHDTGVTPGGTVISSVHDDVILSKLNKSSGNEIWLKEFNSSANHTDHFIGIDADGYGNLYAVGRLFGSSFSSGSEFNYTGGANHSELMIAHYRTDGVFQSFEVIPSSSTSWGMSIGTYKNEKYVVGGYYNNTIAFGSITPSANADNAFVATRNLPPAIDFLSFASNTFFGDAVFCQFEGTVTPNINVPEGGTFEGPPQVFLNSSTGEVDLTASMDGGPYTITYTSTSFSCGTGQFTANIYILVDQSPSFTYTSNTFCTSEPNPSAATIATAGGTFSGPMELDIANPSTGEVNIATSMVGGPYYLVYTTPSTSCPRSDSIQVYIANTPDPSFGYSNNSYCAGTGSTFPTFTVTSGGTFSAPPGLVIVNPTTGEINLNTSSAGTYDVQYLVSNGSCQDSSTVTLTINQSDDATFTYPAAVFCTNESNPVASPIMAGGTFTAPSGLIFANTMGEIDVAGSTAGTYTIVYTTNGANCPTSSSLDIDIIDPPDATFTYDQTLYCSGSGTIFPDFLAVTGGTFSAPVGIDLVDTLTGEININASSVGTYTIQYDVSNANCQETSTFTFTIEQTDNASFNYPSGTHFCYNESNQTPTISGTLGGSFSGSAGLIIDIGTGEIDVLNTPVGGTYDAIYTTNGVNCPTSDTIEVFIEDAPNPSFTYGQSSYCQGAGTIVTPNSITTPGGTFSGPAVLSLDAGTGAINVDASTAGGPYTIQYVVMNTYCQKSTTFEVTILAQDTLVSVEYSNSEYCTSESNQIPIINGAIGGVFSGPTSINIVDSATGEFSPTSSFAGGPYLIQYSTPGVCPDSIGIPITMYDVPTADAGEDQTLYYIFSTFLDAQAALVGNGEWTTTSSGLIGDEFSPNAEVTDLRLGTNTFVWTVTNGVCPFASDEMRIEVEGIYIPQALTPNNDGKNDLFTIQSLDEVTCSLQIFNRWGQLIYENSDYQNEWFGQNMKGQQLENDTYFYVILIDDSISYNGYVVLKK